MEIISLTTGYMGSHEYVLAENGKAIVIDPADAALAEEVLSEKRLIPSLIILTHEHCDHNYECDRIRRKYRCPIYASESCGKNLRDERRNYSKYYQALVMVQGRLPCDEQKTVKPFALEADRVFRNEIKIRWEGHNLLLKETPGHSEGSICILVDNQYLFTGDSLLWNEPVNTRFIGGSKKEYEKITLPWLRTLSDEVLVFPGHLEEFRLIDKLEQMIM